MEPSTPGVSRILTESKTIILASYTHFITLALLFLPLSITLTVTGPTLGYILSLDFIWTFDHKTIICILIIILIYFLTISGIATITYSTHQRFLNNLVNLQTVLKSLTCNFLPLAFTAFIAHVIIFLILLACFMLVGFVVMLVQKLGYVVDYDVVYVILGCVLVVIMMFFYVNWSLAYVVVVVESKWGFSALIRSWYLVKGMRFVSLVIMLYFGVSGGLIVLICLGGNAGNTGVLLIMLGSIFLMIFWLRLIAANTLLFNYCKVLHGELVINEVVEEFGCDYADLPMDVEKVPRVVNVFIV